MVLSWYSHINALYGELPANATLKLWHTPNHLGEMPAQPAGAPPDLSSGATQTIAERHSARRKILL
jgi:hypothetical protein